MIYGAHVVLYSTDAAADRAFFRDILEYPFVDAGNDWLIFALPPAELAVHPADEAGAHELFLMCDDIAAFVVRMTALGVQCAELHTERWGSITKIRLPGGGTLGVYQPSHPSPLGQR
jgi:catechol 2,3-dioxygenase-like lactoylglutathione lyase family enzyme